LIARHLAHPVAGLSVLDLACRTGAFAWPLAAQGARVLGIDGRADNLAIARARSGDRGNPEFRHADVRDIVQWAGRYDVTLCLGLLYHLDADGVWQLLRHLAQRTAGLCIIDTHVGDGESRWTLGGRHYTGLTYADNTTSLWGSIGNTDSAWFDRLSLWRLAHAAGFGAAVWVPGPAYEGEPASRTWLVATPQQRQGDHGS
jgi:SAM-dependent methyltransferase